MYQDLVRQNALKDNQEKALENGDKFKFLNNDHAALISHVIMLEKVGKLQDLYDNLDAHIEMYSTKDPARIAELAEELKEAGKLEGEAGNVFDKKSPEQIVESALEYNKEAKEAVDTYREIATNLHNLFGDRFESSEEMEELIYMFTQTKNLEERYGQVKNNIKEA